ncbi:glycosyltransferase family 1 protein [Intrasporangium sp. DVR]|uniref:glycosyltransferase family 4 protein n=1 Tax=Intrasporangium sp. DVR TaxID=3127867 RepID=UPI00313A5E45
MRVAIVTESFLPSLNGVTTSVCHVAEHLRARGHEGVIIAPRSREPMPATFAGIPVHRITSLPFRQFDVGLPSGEIEQILADAAPDVVHVASPFIIGARGLRAAVRLDLPTVAIFQTDMAGYVRQHTPGSAGNATANTTWRWIRRIHSWADLTLAPSTEALADLRAHGVPRTDLWGRGVDTTLFSPAWRSDALSRALRRELAPGGERLIGYVGRLAPEKELERLAELADVPHSRLVIVGDGPSRPAVGELLTEAVAASPGRPNLPPVFLGPRHGEDLARAYATLDLFVHTGTRETFGQTIQEAGASGLPVVVPRAGGPIDLVTDGENGYLFDPRTPGALREAVCRSLSSPEHLTELGRRGLERVRDRSWAAFVDRLIGHYEAVADRRVAVAA